MLQENTALGLSQHGSAKILEHARQVKFWLGNSSIATEDVTSKEELMQFAEKLKKLRQAELRRCMAWCGDG